MNEYLSKIRFIKMYSWEKPLSKLIASESMYFCINTLTLTKQSKRRLRRGHNSQVRYDRDMLIVQARKLVVNIVLQQKCIYIFILC